MFFFIHTDLNNMNSSYCSFISREVFMQKLEKQFHIHCVESDVGRYVILPGETRAECPALKPMQSRDRTENGQAW